jgi:hypothetical protein
VSTGTDPVRARRARIAALARAGQRAGYGLFLAALVVLVVGFAADFTPAIVTLTTACLIGGCVVLAPSIIAGFAARAAERDDRARGI